MDDDISVDIPKMIEKSGNSLETIGGWLHSKMNVRRRNSKWSLSKVEFEEDTFPDFVSGWAYAMTMSSAKRIVSLAETTSNLWVDDVWVTGIILFSSYEQPIRISKSYNEIFVYLLFEVFFYKVRSF